ncbi:MAG TPA: replication-associated recombination protein A, partial [Solirubrobacterales bacterium]|nr:replication-associated recombination protein A [Solirubrobacterales bacterium]
FEVNSALLSRAQIYELRPLEPGQVEELLRRALGDPERGIANPPAVSDEALEMLARRSGGDARVALSALERAVERADGKVDVAAVEDALQRKALDYDRQGDRHYDFVSAWIKATRGSDVDASLYYLAVMLEGGEDPRFIARRMVILASEDVGNADPQALLVADAAARAVDRVGLPECALNLAQAAVYLALAPKSNASYKALSAARAEVRANGAQTPPDYLRDAHYPGAAELGRGEGYRYAHDEPGAVSDQPLMPEGLRGRRFYEPTGRGFEGELERRLEALRKKLDNS